MAERKSKQINVRLTPSLYKRLQNALNVTGHTMTDALIMMITQYCEEAEKKTMAIRETVATLQELTGRESGVILYGDRGVLCNWSGVRGIPAVFMSGLLDGYAQIPRVRGIHVDDLSHYLDNVELDIMVNDYNAETHPLNSGTVYELGNDIVVITPDGWI